MSILPHYVIFTPEEEIALDQMHAEDVAAYEARMARRAVIAACRAAKTHAA